MVEEYSLLGRTANLEKIRIGCKKFDADYNKLFYGLLREAYWKKKWRRVKRWHVVFQSKHTQEIHKDFTINFYFKFKLK